MSDGQGSGTGPADLDPPSIKWRDRLVARILDVQQRENAARSGFEPAISREMAEQVIRDVLNLFDCRSDSTAAVYAWMSLWRSLGVDFFQSHIAFLPPAADQARDGDPA